MNNILEAAGFALALGFLWFVWPPLVLLGAGVLLVAYANLRRGRGRLGAAVAAAVGAARKAWAASQTEQPTTELRRVA